MALLILLYADETASSAQPFLLRICYIVFYTEMFSTVRYFAADYHYIMSFYVEHSVFLFSLFSFLLTLNYGPVTLYPDFKIFD